MKWEEWDRISVETKGLERLIDWYNEKKPDIHTIRPILPKGFIEIQKSSEMRICIIWKHDEESNTGRLSCWVNHQGLASIQKDMDGEYEISGNDINYHVGDYRDVMWFTKAKELELTPEQTKREKAILLCTSWAAVMHYMAEATEVVMVEREITPSLPNQRAKKKGKLRAKPRKLIRREYTLTPTTSEKKRTIQRHTESWTVRGHWRKTSAGRTWVKPHVKGKAKPSQAVYEL